MGPAAGRPLCICQKGEDYFFFAAFLDFLAAFFAVFFAAFFFFIAIRTS